MASCIQSMLFIGFVGSLATFMLFIYEWNETREMKAKGLNQELRRKLLRDMCDGHKEAYAGGKKRFEDMTSSEWSNFIVDDKHGIIYCIIPKVACTNWKRILFVLSRGKPHGDLLSIPGYRAHDLYTHTHLDRLPRAERKAKLKHYTKFLFVRNPFARLISAYRDKFMKRNWFYYPNYARGILRQYGNMPDPPKSVDEAFAAGVRPSFENFTRFLVDRPSKYFDVHWRQVTRLCHPCLIEYDFIGHHENLEEDADKLLKMLNLEDEIKFPRSQEKNTTSSDLELDWYRKVPLEDKKKLYKIYEWDFKLFGYQPPDDLLDS